MADYPVEFSDPGLRILYREVVRKSGEGNNHFLDQPLPTLNFTRHRPGPPIPPDQSIQSAEVFKLVAERRDFGSVYRRFAKEGLPWEPSRTSLNRKVLGSFDRMVSGWRQRNPGEPHQSPALANVIYQWVLDPDGLGISPDRYAPEQGFDRVVRSKRADCTEFVFIFLALFSRAGFKAEPEWVGVDLWGDATEHVVTALTIGKKTFYLDPNYDSFHATHQQHAPMTRRQLLGFYWSNRAGNAKDTDPRLAQRFYDRAMQIDPHNPQLFVNRGLLHLAQGPKSWRLARQDFQSALALDPQYFSAHHSLGALYFKEGNYQEAVHHDRLAVRGDPQNPKFRRGLVLSLGRLGRFGPAREQLRVYSSMVGSSSSLGRSIEVKKLEQYLAYYESKSPRR